MAEFILQHNAYIINTLYWLSMKCTRVKYCRRENKFSSFMNIYLFVLFAVFIVRRLTGFSLACTLFEVWGHVRTALHKFLIWMYVITWSQCPVTTLLAVYYRYDVVGIDVWLHAWRLIVNNYELVSFIIH